jgi:hypothetical protein
MPDWTAVDKTRGASPETPLSALTRMIRDHMIRFRTVFAACSASLMTSGVLDRYDENTWRAGFSTDFKTELIAEDTLESIGWRRSNGAVKVLR